MKTNSATPRPWATDIRDAIELLDKGERIDGATIYYNGNTSSRGNEIATLRHDPEDWLDLHDPELQANAALIVRAVNSHDELVAALDAAHKAMFGPEFDDLEKLRSRIETALRNARAEG